MKPAPYVGVSGVTTRAEAEALLAAWPSDAPPRSLMIGVLASSKTLCGKTNKYPARYPLVGEIAAIFPDDPRALNLVHVACDSDPSSIDGKRIPAEIDMTRAFTAGGPRCHGVQLNGATARTNWETLATFRAACPRAERLVLQVGPMWLATVTDNNTSALRRLPLFAAYATDVLLDVSGGKGIAISYDQAACLVEQAIDSAPGLRIGIAGGLSFATLPMVARLVRARGLSIDAEGRLRDDDDKLDLDKARDYLRAAAPLISGDR